MEVVVTQIHEFSNLSTEVKIAQSTSLLMHKTWQPSEQHFPTNSPKTTQPRTAHKLKPKNLDSLTTRIQQKRGCRELGGIIRGTSDKGSKGTYTHTHTHIKGKVYTDKGEDEDRE